MNNGNPLICAACGSDEIEVTLCSPMIGDVDAPGAARSIDFVVTGRVPVECHDCGEWQWALTASVAAALRTDCRRKLPPNCRFGAVDA
jgi:hypothetical protein